MATMVLVISISCLVAFTFWFPHREKTQNYYLAKDMMICVFIYVTIPLIIVKNNLKMRKYLKHHFKNSRFYRGVNEYWDTIRMKAKLKNNKIVSMFVIKIQIKRQLKEYLSRLRHFSSVQPWAPIPTTEKYFYGRKDGCNRANLGNENTIKPKIGRF